MNSPYSIQAYADGHARKDIGRVFDFIWKPYIYYMIVLNFPLIFLSKGILCFSTEYIPMMLLTPIYLHALCNMEEKLVSSRSSVKFRLDLCELEARVLSAWCH
jgi:hypothetical protein